jgi:murein DD-endopeptidase MepM/ murein hydrolase activator NlpD
VYRGIRSVAVKIGDMVDQNQMLAQAGEDGRIFFALFYENEPVNPMQYMSLY